MNTITTNNYSLLIKDGEDTLYLTDVYGTVVEFEIDNKSVTIEKNGALSIINYLKSTFNLP